MGLHVDRHLYPAEIMKCANVIISFMFFPAKSIFFLESISMYLLKSQSIC